MVKIRDGDTDGLIGFLKILTPTPPPFYLQAAHIVE